MTPIPQELDDLQRWMQAVITHPDGVASGLASAEATSVLDVSARNLSKVVLPSSQMNSLERLQIYGRAYFGRLIECLRAQFPATCHAIGEEAFDGLAFGYLVHRPSQAYTLSKLGESFDAYLAETRPAKASESDESQPDFADFLVDLTRLERTYNEVFDETGPEQGRSMEPADFIGISAEEFAQCGLFFHDCVRALELRFPVHEYATTIRRGDDPAPPAPRAVKLVVTRRKYVVRRYELSAAQFALITALWQGATIGEALEGWAGNDKFDVARFATDVRAWFLEWSAAPLFAGLNRPTAGR